MQTPLHLDKEIIQGLIPWNADELHEAVRAARGDSYDLMGHLLQRYPERTAKAYFWRWIEVTRFFTENFDRLKAEGLIALDQPDEGQGIIARALLEQLAESPFSRIVMNEQQQKERRFETDEIIARAKRNHALDTQDYTDTQKEGHT